MPAAKQIRQRVAAAVVAGCLLHATTADAQESDDPRVCWRGRPACGSFIVFETRIGVDLINDLQRGIQLRAGLMRNVDSEVGL